MLDQTQKFGANHLDDLTLLPQVGLAPSFGAPHVGILSLLQTNMKDNHPRDTLCISLLSADMKQQQRTAAPLLECHVTQLPMFT